jgi:hypothetical protein
MNYTDQHYTTPQGTVHFLSSQDQANAAAQNLPLPDTSWTAVTPEQALAISNPPLMLAQAQAARIAIINEAYAMAVQLSISFTTVGGITKLYQADNQGPLSSQAVLLKAYTGYAIAGATPEGFFWKSEDNTHVEFTLADLGGLYLAMLEQGNAAFRQRETLKAAINAATTVAAVEAILWD